MDNVQYTPGSGIFIAAREVTYSGESVKAQAVGLVTFDGPDDNKTVADVSVDNPLPIVGNQTDDLLRMLSRIVKLLESNAVVDAAQRQRVVIDAGTLTTVTTVTALSNAIAIAGMDREQHINVAKNTYANSIRSKLEFV
jgi:hypothetical protein